MVCRRPVCDAKGSERPSKGARVAKTSTTGENAPKDARGESASRLRTITKPRARRRAMARAIETPPRRGQKPDRTLKKTRKKGPRHDCGAARETTGNGTGDRDAERGPVAPKTPPRYIESSSKQGESVGKAARQAASERIAKQTAAAMFCPRWRRAL